jgi:hypothetical protein
MTTPERPKLPPITCTPWCENNDGHTDAVFQEDQTCWGPESYVGLSRESSTLDESGAYVPRTGAQAYRHFPGEVPCIYVHLDNVQIPPGRDDGILDDQLKLTADEAIKLATALLDAAALVNRPGDDVRLPSA